MDIRTLYTLIAIADHGSFAEAGNTIGLSLSAIWFVTAQAHRPCRPGRLA